MKSLLKAFVFQGPVVPSTAVVFVVAVILLVPYRICQTESNFSGLFPSRHPQTWNGVFFFLFQNCSHSGLLFGRGVINASHLRRGFPLRHTLCLSLSLDRTKEITNNDLFCDCSRNTIVNDQVSPLSLFCWWFTLPVSLYSAWKFKPRNIHTLTPMLVYCVFCCDGLFFPPAVRFLRPNLSLFKWWSSYSGGQEYSLSLLQTFGSIILEAALELFRFKNSFVLKE